MTRTPRVLIMAGGTGGHIFPGLAVAENLVAQGWQVSWLGTAERMEAQLVPKHGIEIDFIDIKGVRNKGIFRKLLTPFMVINAIWQACKTIQKRKPDVVLGLGGYAALPGGIAARLLAKPLAIHEQNAAAGLTNKILSRIANQTLMAFSHTKGLALQTPVVGNPVRRLIMPQIKTAKSELSILVIGGSLGAKVLNENVPVAIEHVEKQGYKVNLVHQSGKGNKQEVKHAYKQVESQIAVVEFIDDMASAYQQADLVICRAGALTVSELALAGKASVLVPLPHAVDDHQTKNASILADVNAGILLPQQKLIEGQLSKHLVELIELPNLLPEMAKNCEKVAIPDSTDKVCRYIKKLAQE